MKSQLRVAQVAAIRSRLGWLGSVTKQAKSHVLLGEIKHGGGRRSAHLFDTLPGPPIHFADPARDGLCTVEWQTAFNG
jgi:hypothetical protein